MGRFRFSMTSFLAFITALALGLAAMVSQSDLAGRFAYSVFVGFLCFALAGAFLSRAETRPFWVGLAVFGWIYWFIESDASTAGPAPAPLWGRENILYSSSVEPPSRPRLVTSAVVDAIEGSLFTQRRIGAPVMARWGNGGYYPGTIVQVNGGDYLVQWTDGSAPQWTPNGQLRPRSTTAAVAGHALMGFLFAIVGGALASLAFGKRKEPTTTP